MVTLVADKLETEKFTLVWKTNWIRPIVCADSEVQAPVNSPDIQTPVILPCTSNCSTHSTLSGSTAVTPDDAT